MIADGRMRQSLQMCHEIKLSNLKILSVFGSFSQRSAKVKVTHL